MDGRESLLHFLFHLACVLKNVLLNRSRKRILDIQKLFLGFALSTDDANRLIKVLLSGKLVFLPLLYMLEGSNTLLEVGKRHLYILDLSVDNGCV